MILESLWTIPETFSKSSTRERVVWNLSYISVSSQIYHSVLYLYYFHPCQLISHQRSVWNDVFVSNSSKRREGRHNACPFWRPFSTFEKETRKPTFVTNMIRYCKAECADPVSRQRNSEPLCWYCWQVQNEWGKLFVLLPPGLARFAGVRAWSQWKLPLTFTVAVNATLHLSCITFQNV